MRNILLPALLLACILAGCTAAARPRGSPADTVAGSPRPTGKASSATSAPKGAGPTSPAEPTATADTTLTPFKLTNWIDICQDENGRWQEGLENYHPTSPGGVHTNTWKLGEFQAELYHKIADGDLVVENTYTTGWTLPDTITPGTTVQVPVTCNGKHVETYVGQATEKTWHAGSPESYGSTCFGLYVGADKSKGGGGYDISSLSDFDNQGYVELEVRRGAPVNKVLEIRVEYTCGDMVMGKVYYYER